MHREIINTNPTNSWRVASLNVGGWNDERQTVVATLLQLHQLDILILCELKTTTPVLIQHIWEGINVKMYTASSIHKIQSKLVPDPPVADTPTNEAVAMLVRGNITLEERATAMGDNLIVGGRWNRGNNHLNVIGVYAPPRLTAEQYEAHMARLQQAVEKVLDRDHATPLLIGGDYNARVGSWGETWEPLPRRSEEADGAGVPNHRAPRLIEMSEELDIRPLHGLHPDLPAATFTFSRTTGKSIIDYIFANRSIWSDSTKWRTWTATAQPFDHSMMGVQLHLPQDAPQEQTPIPPASPRYPPPHHRSWNGFADRVATQLQGVTGNTQERYDSLTQSWKAAAKPMIVPVRAASGGAQPQASRGARRIRTIKRLLRKARGNRKAELRRELYNRRQRDLHHRGCNTSRALQRRLPAMASRPRQVWRMVHQLLETPQRPAGQPPPPPPQPAADKVLQFLRNKFEGQRDPPLPPQNVDPPRAPKPAQVLDLSSMWSIPSLKAAVKKYVKSDCSPGPDQVPQSFFHHMGDTETEDIILTFIGEIFKDCISTGVLPKQWNLARIAAFYKGSGDKLDPANYRYIAVADIMQRLFFSMLNEHLQEWSDTTNQRTNTQRAFRKGGNTELPIHSLHQLERHTLRCRKGTANQSAALYVGFLDITNAYDTVPHSAIAARLEEIGLDPRIRTIVTNMLQLQSLM